MIRLDPRLYTTTDDEKMHCFDVTTRCKNVYVSSKLINQLISFIP